MKHFPVLLTEVLQCLDPKEGDTYLDLTAGYGGHAEAILERTLQPKRSTLVDRDNHAITDLQTKFEGSGIEILHGEFHTVSQELQESKRTFDIILADLGVSSPHLDNANRGFSIRSNGPLDMRMDQRQSLTAEEIVNNYDEASIRDLVRKYGEDPRATKIARLIVEHRPFATTHELASVVARAWPGYSKVHPATRTFQALRIAVNAELELLTKALPIWVDLLNPGGRIAVISFHSLEDAVVKSYFKENAGNRYDAQLHLLTKQPVIAAHPELVSNPRARSAKLRAAVKINT